MHLNDFDFSTLYNTKTYKKNNFEVTLKELSVLKMQQVDIALKRNEHDGLALALEFASDGVITKEIYNSLPTSVQLELLQIYNELNIPAGFSEKILKN